MPCAGDGSEERDSLPVTNLPVLVTNSVYQVPSVMLQESQSFRQQEIPVPGTGSSSRVVPGTRYQYYLIGVPVRCMYYYAVMMR